MPPHTRKRIYKSLQEINPEPVKTVDKSHAAKISGGVARLFNDTRFSDVTIYLGHVSLPAHALVLSSQSEYFEKALTGQFKESQTKVFRYTEGNMQAYWRLFEYLYTGLYSDDPEPRLDVLGNDDNALTRHVRVYSLADYFMIKGLKEYAFGRFEEEMDEQCAIQNQHLPEYLKDAYANTDATTARFKEAIIKMCGVNVPDLWYKINFKKVVREGGDFAVDLINAIM